MKKFIIIFLLFNLTGCSFDNKTGIWKDASKIPIEKIEKKDIENTQIKKYEEIFITQKVFDEEVDANPNTKVKFNEAININRWLEEYLTETNNISNISYQNNKAVIFKSSRLSRSSNILNSEFARLKTPLFLDNQLISHDNKGNIFVYNLDERKKTINYNFYKKAFKKYKKKIKIVINDNVIYAADNLGYIYSINMQTGSLIWAKNYGIPFRSNVKVINDQLILANEENTIYSINIENGTVNWKFGTSKSFLNNDFENSIAIDSLNSNILYLNTNGELYSINYLKKNINWVLNFKNSSFSSDINSFLSQPIIIKDDNLIVSTSRSLFNYNVASSQKKWGKPLSAAMKPVATKENIFLITNDKKLICLDLKTGNILWSKSTLSHLKHGVFKKKKKKKLEPL